LDDLLSAFCKLFSSAKLHLPHILSQLGVLS
jgi:hypothetical protein